MTPADIAARRRRARARKGEGDQLRHEILAATAELLLETGSEEAVSIRAVADAVGVTPPSIYRHFADKSALIYSVCLSSFNGLADDIEAAIVPGDRLATLKAQAHAYVHYGVNHPEHYRLMFMTQADATPEDLPVALFAPGTAFALFLETVEQILDAGLIRDEIAALGATQVSIHLWAMVHGLTSLYITKPALPWGELDPLIDHHLEVIISGVAASP